MIEMDGDFGGEGGAGGGRGLSAVRVSVGAVWADYSGTAPSIPIEVLDRDGAEMAREVVSARGFLRIELPKTTIAPIFVRARLPSGEQETRRVDHVDHGREPLVTLFADYKSPNEWLAWSRPQVRVDRLQSSKISLQGKFGNVWTILWKCVDGRWRKIALRPNRVEQNTLYAAQFELELEHGAFLLQIGGVRLPWRFVSLPGGGRVRIMLTENTSSDPRADALRISVSRLKHDEDVLLAYLLRDRLQDTKKLAESMHLGEQLFAGKYLDPVSACVGAYVLIRTGGLARRIDWAENLYRDFDWLPDGAAIYAWGLMCMAKPDVKTARRALATSIRRGYPVFREGLRVLQEVSALLVSANSSGSRVMSVRKWVNRLAVAEAWSGTSLGFYGRHPDRPLTTQYVGLPNSRETIDPYAGRISFRRILPAASSNKKDVQVVSSQYAFLPRTTAIQDRNAGKELAVASSSRRTPKHQDANAFFLVGSPDD